MKFISKYKVIKNPDDGVAYLAKREKISFSTFGLTAKKILDTLHLVVRFLLNFINKLLMNKINTISYDSIGKYNLIKEVKNSGPNRPYLKVGVYVDGENDKYFIKTWRGFVKDYNYFTLKNEINTLKSLNDIQDSLSDEDKVKYKIRIIRFVEEIESPRTLSLVEEYVEEQSDIKEHVLLDVFTDSVLYIDHLGKKLPKKVVRCFNKRDPVIMLFMYPFVVLRSVVNSPNLVLKFLQASYLYLKTYPIQLDSYKESLSHKDLHPENMIFDGKEIVLVDFQFTSFSDCIFDYIKLVRGCWENKHIRNKIITKIHENIAERGASENALTGYMSFSAVQAFNNRYASDRLRLRNEKFLNYVVNKNTLTRF